MRTSFKLLGISTLLLLASSCSDFVQNVDSQIDTISDTQLNSQEQVAFVTTGVKTRFATTHDQITLLAGGLSDEEVFDQDVPNATYPQYDQINRGEILFDNNSVDGLYNDLGELRLFADTLVTRVNQIEFTSEYEADKTDALFYGNFFGGVARYFFATYFGLEPTQGGGVINNGPFIPSSEMYQRAISKLEEANKYATAYQKKVIASTEARIYLYDGDYPNAYTAAQAGLENGDAPFQSLHSIESDNAWYFGGGKGRSQFVADDRFYQYTQDDSLEANRIPLTPIEGASGKIWHFQDKYPDRGSPINFISWQENNLMLAELELRVNSDQDAARTLINEVRSSHGLDEYLPTDPIDLDVIYLERDKELFTTGARLPDQRRFDRWHLGAGTWQYLPITAQERNNNPNL